LSQILYYLSLTHDIRMKVVLISTYELGRQPFGLASPTAWLQEAGATVTCLDLSVSTLEAQPIREADLIAFYLPMHTATRMAVKALSKVKALNPKAHLCFYGLYAPINAAYLKKMGANTILGGEFEEGLVELVDRIEKANSYPAENEQTTCNVSLGKQRFVIPERGGLPPLTHYAHLRLGDGTQRVVGYTEASRGCKHLCRHCPVVPIYQGQFRIVQKEIVLADIKKQVEAGAQHITFGDPDFFNGIRHALDIVASLHREYPGLSYDVTIKIEHLLKHSQHLKTLRDTGCLFVTSAVESIDDTVLQLFNKGHSRSDFLRVVRLFNEIELPLSPTFVTFTPWTTWEGYRELLMLLTELDLIDNVSPIQLAIRLLIPAGSKLLELPKVRQVIGDFDETSLSYRWSHIDPRLDQLCNNIRKLVKNSETNGQSRREIFSAVWNMASPQVCLQDKPISPFPLTASRATIPYLNEPWYC
jgi:radical SAM superfamily enzyme YgiQ (UPF0313 family)